MHNRFARTAPGCYIAVIAAVLLAACDRPPARSAHADTLAAAGPDTLVRRVIRVLRQPSAMQRVTGATVTLRALQPLDSVLAVRVMDQRGRVLDGVRVSWTLLSTAEGAQLRAINARTDTLGISRVAFTPGRTAIPQTVVAEVAGVGRISFSVTVPAASIQLASERRAFWSDDEESISASLRDVGGEALEGGPMVWGTTDSTILAVTSSDATVARVRGKRAGAADVVAWIEPGRVRAYLRLSVKPVVSGSFVTVHGGPVPAMRMEIRAGALRDSVSVVDGRFVKRIDLPASHIELRAAPSADWAFHRVHLDVATPAALQNSTIALIPTSWRIEGGTYDAREIPIDAAGALRRPAGSAAFWRLAPFGAATGRLSGWPEAALPLRVAFNRSRSSDRISPEDSVEFWRIADQMQRDLGERLFVPAEFGPETVSSGIVPIETGTVKGGSGTVEGHAFVTWNEAGDAYDAVLMFRAASTLRNAHVVTHELLHLLGFGHATSFRSVSQAVSGTEPRLTPEDVAYAQLAIRLRRLQAQRGARPGFPVAGQ